MTRLLLLSLCLLVLPNAGAPPPSHRQGSPALGTITMNDQQDMLPRTRPLVASRSRPVPARPRRRVHRHAIGGFSRVELRVRWCESHNNYRDHNSSSGASGAWQFLDSTWADFMGYRRAMDAPRWVQDLKARRTFSRDGLRPWYASRACWA